MDNNKSSMKHKFVFICGLHRSGTTILHECMRDHPDISGFYDTGAPHDEGQHLQDVFLPAYKFGGPGKFGFDQRAVLNEKSQLISSENRERLFKAWGKYWDLSKPVLIEKSPPNLIRTLFFQEMFHNSYFVILLRHPVPVSLATKRWSKTSLYSLFNHWFTCHNLFLKDQPKLKRSLIINYENFIIIF